MQRQRGLGPFLEAFGLRVQPRGSAPSCCFGRRTPCEYCTGERCRWCGLLTCRPGCEPPPHIGRRPCEPEAESV